MDADPANLIRVRAATSASFVLPLPDHSEAVVYFFSPKEIPLLTLRKEPRLETDELDAVRGGVSLGCKTLLHAE